jgi:hypothetical protein
MKRSILNIMAVLGVAFALSGCIIAPFHHHHDGYGGGYNNGGGYYQGGGGYNHNGY